MGKIKYGKIRDGITVNVIQFGNGHIKDEIYKILYYILQYVVSDWLNATFPNYLMNMFIYLLGLLLAK